MSFWSSERWKSQPPPGEASGRNVVDLYDEKRVHQGSYELTLGDSYMVSAADASRKVVKDKEQVCIPPGQFALLTTREVVTIPSNAVGWISIKSTLKLRGLVNISGFHVDPGFSHRLKFAVYNAGGSQVTLTYGAPVFLLWLAHLDRPTQDLYPNAKLDELWPITDSDVMNLSHELASPAKLRVDLDKLDVKVNVLISGVLIAILLTQLRACVEPVGQRSLSSPPVTVSVPAATLLPNSGATTTTTPLPLHTPVQTLPIPSVHPSVESTNPTP
jgi:dCTP deaminase